MASAIAVFNSPRVKGETLFTQVGKNIKVQASFQTLPPGEHGFHIHKAGDLRGKGCAGLCDHFHKGHNQNHGPSPRTGTRRRQQRHTGDLGNIRANKKYSFTLDNLSLSELYGRSVVVHADKDDLGKGNYPDSKTTGHSGKRIGCAIIGRVGNCSPTNTMRKTRKVRK
jgi:Cu-Zn family superoxide dismutase